MRSASCARTRCSATAAWPREANAADRQVRTWHTGSNSREGDIVGVATSNDAEKERSYSRGYKQSNPNRRIIVGTKPDAQDDLALKAEDAEKVVGGVKKKTAGKAAFVAGSRDSTNVQDGTPLDPFPDETYMQSQ
jgi:hypothetical protein